MSEIVHIKAREILDSRGNQRLKSMSPYVAVGVVVLRSLQGHRREHTKL